MQCCTVVARNYAAHARVLAATLAQAEPDARLQVLLLDGTRADGDGEPFDVLLPEDVGLDPATYAAMAALYDVLELSTAVKPWLLSALLDRGGPAVYLDPDIWVHAPLGDVAAAAGDAGLLLTPHCLHPVPRDGRRPTEVELLRSGAHNLGFVAVTDLARPFLAWWRERLARDCLVAVEEGLFVDQRWVDLAVTHFPHAAQRHPGWNVAYWNAHERDVARAGDGWTAAGEPLVFAHFSGFDPHVPHVLSRHTLPDPRVLLSDHPALAALCTGYAERLLAAGWDEAAAVPYRWGASAAGVPLGPGLRRRLRDGHVAADAGLAPPPPDPFDPAGAAILTEWLAEPADPRVPAISRYLLTIWEARDDVRRVHPDLFGADSEGFLAWVRAFGAREHRIPDAFLPPGPVAAPQEPAAEHLPLTVTARFAEGVNVVGYVKAESGVGQAVRGLVAALEAVGIPHAVVPCTDTVHRQEVAVAARGEPRYDVTIACVNADQFPRWSSSHPELVAGRHVIGMWAWEVEEMPAAMAAAAGLVDEIWMNSRFAAEAVARAVARGHRDVPVLAMPLAIVPPVPAGRDRSALLGVPEGFTCLFAFDFLSVADRKNPWGVVDAFTTAFPTPCGPQLLLKSTNGGDRVRHLEQLRAHARGRPDVHVRDGYVSGAAQAAMIAAADCYVSLHRAEGFGLTVAEAMALGTPVVTTAYGGVLEVADPMTAFLVDYELIAIPAGNDPYPTTARWAAPNVESAARALRLVHDRPDLAAATAARARDGILRHHSPAVRGAQIAARLRAIRAERGVGRAASVQVEAARAALDQDLLLGPQVAREAAERAGGLLSAPAATGRRTPAGAARRVVARLHARDRDRQHAIDAALLEAVAQVDARRAAETVGLREAARELADAVAATQEELARLRARTAAIPAGTPHEIGGRVAALETQVGRLQARAAESATAIGALDELASAPPYLDDPGALRLGLSLGYDDPGAEVPERDRYRALEDRFRGPEELVRERQRPYLPELRAPLLDLGCGRGELLDLCAEGGIDAVGCDTDDGMVARCLAKGRKAEVADAMEALAATEPGTIGTVTLMQVVEHLDPAVLAELFAAAHRALRPGGLLLVETVNPHNLAALRTFWVDLTHRHPLYPEVLVEVARAVGFASAVVRCPLGTGAWDSDRRTEGEYALLARTAGG